MKLRIEETASFAGGMNDSAAATAYKRNEAQEIVNCRITADGTAQVRGGSRRLSSESPEDAQGYGGARFVLTNGASQLVVFVGSKAFASDDEGETWTEIASGLNEAFWSLTTMRIGAAVCLIAANGGEFIYRWDGEMWGTLSHAPQGVQYVATFNDRLYVAGHDGNIVAASKIRDPETWDPPDGLRLQVAIHDGGAITGIAVAEQRLLVFKRHSIAWIDGFGNSDIIVAQGPRGVSQSIGCVAHRTIQPVGDRGVMWLSERCIHAYGGGQVHSVTDRQLREFFAHQVDWATIDSVPGLPTAVYHPAYHEYWLALPSGTQLPQNNKIVVVHAATGALTLFSNGGLSPSADPILLVNAQGTTVAVLPVTYSGEAVEDLDAVDLTGPFGDAKTVTLSIGEFSFELMAYAATAVHHGYDHAALFQGGRDRILSVGFDGVVRHLDSGASDDELPDGSGGVPFEARIRTRPFLYNAPFYRKRARAIDVLATASESAWLQVAVVSRGETGAVHLLSIAASAGSQPRRARAMVDGVGETLQVELRTSVARLRIAGVRLAAEVLRQVA